MSNYRRTRVPGALYFFTVTTRGRQPLLTHAAVRAALRSSIGQVRELFPFTIEGWVLLPDHMHCLWRLPEGDADYGKRWGLIKRHVTRALGIGSIDKTPSQRKRHEGNLWQRRFWEHLIRDEDDYRKHMDYLHWNPVKHGYVKHVVDWPHSSFHRYVKAGLLPVDWGGESVAADGNFGE